MDNPRIMYAVNVNRFSPYGVSGWRACGLVQDIAGGHFVYRRAFAGGQQSQIGYHEPGAQLIRVVPAVDRPGFVRNTSYHMLAVCSVEAATGIAYPTAASFESEKQRVEAFAKQLELALKQASTTDIWPAFTPPDDDTF